MPSYRDFHPTEHLTYHDLQGRPDTTLQIEKVVEGQRWNNSKREACLIVRFVGKKKGLRLNATINTQISHKCGFGIDFDKWPGKWVTVFHTTDESIRGDDKNCLRVRPAKAEDVKRAEAAMSRTAAPATTPSGEPVDQATGVIGGAA